MPAHSAMSGHYYAFQVLKPIQAYQG